jgi:hypothetical protein
MSGGRNSGIESADGAGKRVAAQKAWRIICDKRLRREDISLFFEAWLQFIT